MRITVVGAILIVATVMASLLLLVALTENKNGLDDKQDSGSQGWQHGRSA